ncbi:Holliday junction resolvase RuvX [Patescibacteria group bacterium]
MKILGIDFGLKNIGLAISDGYLAEPFGALTFKDLKDAVEKIANICLKNEIDLMVLGVPEGKILSKIESFSKSLGERTSVPLVFQDETLTTKEAEAKMFEAGKPKQKRKKDKHIISACLILQSYIDQKREK